MRVSHTIYADNGDKIEIEMRDTEAMALRCSHCKQMFEFDSYDDALRVCEEFNRHSAACKVTHQ
jgi:hypothetical protein